MKLRRGVIAVAVVAVVAWLARRNLGTHPIVSLMTRLRLPVETRSSVQRQLVRAVYETVYRLILREDVGFMNYGYASLDEQAESPDLAASGPDRFSIQLYERVVGKVALGGLDVLEVGSGRGGGAAYVFDRHRPRSMTGLDLTRQAVDYSSSRYAQRGLRYVMGDAEQLPFPDASFDAVVNVESSHCYRNVPRFLAEVIRVLRPGGMILFADLRPARLEGAESGSLLSDVATLRAQLDAAGLAVVEEEEITANVVRALELDSPRRRDLIERAAPKVIHSRLLEFAAVEGSGMFRALAAGELRYLCMVLQRVRDVEGAAAG